MRNRPTEPDRIAEAPIPFVDLRAQRERIAARIDAAVARVLEHGAYIMGPEIHQLEQRLAAFTGRRHAVTCGSGTDALLLALLARGIGRGDAVLCPGFTFAATAEAVALTGATPVFLDVLPESFTLDCAGIEAAVALAKAEGLTPAAIIPVDLFGHPADYAALEDQAARFELFVLADAAQSIGASLHGKPAGGFGDIAATSFYPAKPLGCYGDGGAVLTDDDGMAAVLRSLRMHGEGGDGSEYVRIGLNGRMDTIQAAILLEKLAIFADEITARREIAQRYTEALGDAVITPVVAEGAAPVWAQYTIQVDDRARVAALLKAQGIPTAVYYPRPLHRQPAYAGFPHLSGGLPVSEQLCERVLSLPIHPYLDAPTQDRIVSAIRAAL